MLGAPRIKHPALVPVRPSLLAAVCSLLIAGCTAAVAAPQTVSQTVGQGVRHHMADPEFPSCGGPGTSPWAILASISPGHSATELQGAEFSLHSVVSNTPEAPFDPGARAVAIFVSSTDPAAAVAALHRQPAVAAVGSLYPQSHTPGLTSCNLQLSDVPKAQPYIQAGERALVGAGVATQQALDQGAIFISDDPLDASQLIFSAQVSTGVAYTLPGLPTPAFGGPLMHTRGVVALVSRTTYRVTQAGFDAWANGE